MAQDAEAALELLTPCRLCGAGETVVKPTHLPPRMSGPGAIVSVEIRHCCDGAGMGVRREINVRGRDYETAIEAWNA